ncbi:hypothetical protein GNZ01_07450 [Escherichia coli]|jgi:hypothetical protein|uniref:Phage protein n=4 Tax=root TaxID=1 RepID=A0AAJ2Y356_ECOLX|nr:hypothetical protein [Escherichia coli]YP_009101898.1 hypothetical protein PBI_121Q_311 [Escherichia phage 121Q]YP_009150552.1 hypothetical protein ACQ29_gp238 [Escherichia phage PBECO4]AXC37021.1 hypothetical protein [Escherichia phage UB]MED6536247.1 hypothetical protein [Escherichia coli O157]WGM49289.1 hypothetical protein EcMJ_046 [Escherichia phage vB_Ec-M-J]WPK18463.1 hypothetical protein [Salmonella phage SD-2_S15]WPK19779.1 hypothetical protein [Salmonella phage SD-1_S14]
MTVEEVKKVLAVLRYHNHCKVKNDPDYLDSSLEEDTLQAISHMQKMLKRMTEKNRPDYIGNKI